MSISPRLFPHILLLIATAIYAFTYTAIKQVVPEHINAYSLTWLRIAGASVFFLVAQFFFPSEKIDKKDWIKIALSGLFGAGINQVFFIKSLELTSPIMGAIIMTLMPVMVMIMSYFFLKEPVSSQKFVGVIVGLLGAVLLIFMSSSEVTFSSPNPILGNFLNLLNAFCYALYIILAKQLMTKYSPFQLIKWIYLFGFVWVTPFIGDTLWEVEWMQISTTGWGYILFIVFFTSCIAYSCNIVALSKVRPTTATIYVFLQPIFAALIAIVTGSDTFSVLKVVAMVLVLIGVLLVSRSPSKE